MRAAVKTVPLIQTERAQLKRQLQTVRQKNSPTLPELQDLGGHVGLIKSFDINIIFSRGVSQGGDESAVLRFTQARENFGGHGGIADPDFAEKRVALFINGQKFF